MISCNIFINGQSVFMTALHRQLADSFNGTKKTEIAIKLMDEI